MTILWKKEKIEFLPRPFLDKKGARCYDTIYS